VTTSAKTTSMFKPNANEKVPDWTLAFFRQRNKNRIHDLVIKSMKKFGISQAELARRLGRRPDVVCRWIGAPGNWTLDTVSDLLFAISGLEVAYEVGSPLDGPTRNFESPDWLMNSSAKGTSITPSFTVSNQSKKLPSFTPTLPRVLTKAQVKWEGNHA
jgi:hypothetical protein